MMMAENAGGVRRSLAHDESAREKQTPLTLRNEAQLNCVSLRPEFDCEVTWRAVKGQDERPLRGALDSSASHHRRSIQLGKELIKDGRHVGLDFLRPSHRSIQTIRSEQSARNTAQRHLSDRGHTQTHLFASECDWSISLIARLSRA